MILSFNLKHINRSILRQTALIFLVVLVFTACKEPPSHGGSGGGESSSSDKSAGDRQTITDPMISSATGDNVLSGASSEIDISNTSEGYIMIKYSGSSEKVQIQITNPNGEMYPYPYAIGDYRAFPLTGGNGTYTVEIYENVAGDAYAVAQTESFDVSLSDEFKPYLYPNQYVGYTKDSSVIKKGIELSDSSSDDLNFLTRVYEYTIENIVYDTEFAANAPVNYIPDPDRTLSSKKGICFDYSSVMCSMLRSQGIPTKLVVGYSGEAYHAWISVYLKESGWVENIIEFDGSSWSLMDPTLAANNDAASVGQYIGDGSNYTDKYWY